MPAYIVTNDGITGGIRSPVYLLGQDQKQAGQAVIDQCGETGGGVVLLQPGIYSLALPWIVRYPNVKIIGQNTEVHLQSGVLFGIQFDGGDVSNSGVSDLSVIGDTGTDCTGVGTASTPNAFGDNVLISNVKVSNCQRGILFDTGSNPWSNVSISRCRAQSIGSGGAPSGHGYGIVLSGITSGSVIDSFTDQTARHGIYISASTDVEVRGNTVKRNRQGDATLGDQFGAIEIARSSNVDVVGNSLVDNWHGAISIEPDESNLNNICRAIRVLSNDVIGSRDQDIFVGGPAAGVGTSLLRDVLIGYNSISRIASSLVESIRIHHGESILIEENAFDLDNLYVALYTAIVVGDDQQGLPTNLIQRLKIGRNTGKLSAANGSGAVFVYFNDNACVSSADMRVEDNEVGLSGPAQQVAYGHPAAMPPVLRTSTSIIVERNAPRQRALNYSASITPDPETDGAETLTINVNNANAFAFAATLPNNIGAKMILEITNGTANPIAPPTFDAQYRLNGALANLATTKILTLGFEFNGTSWIELYRSVT